MSSSEWKEVALDEIVDVLGDGLHGTPKYDENGDYYFINGNNLNGNIIIDEKTKKVNYEEFQKYSKDLNERTILVSINGTLGNIALYNGEKVVLGKSACYLNVKENYSKEYIKYIMLSHVFRHYINTYSTGTTIKNMGLKQIRAFRINLPEIKEQKAIAHILSTIDDKIEVNNQINKTLESMAQAIFKHWFIDFEFPNESGEPYKSSGGEMIDSELGMIPKGWEVSNLNKIAFYLNGLPMQKFRAKDDESDIPVMKIKELRQGNTDENSERCSSFIEKDYIINDGDIIFSWSGSLLVDIWCGGICGLNQHLFKVYSVNYDKWFYYLWTVYHLDKFIQIAQSKATTMGHIKREDLENAKVIIPNDYLYNLASDVLGPIFDSIIVNRIESREIKSLRDTLLPKLMSGEIRVPLNESGDEQ